MAVALLDTLASRKAGKDIWYRFWTCIGPCTTDRTELRALFPDRQTALRSNAMTHIWSFFELVDLPDDTPGNWYWNLP